MPRALDEAKAINEHLDRLRRTASVLAFELKKMARVLRDAEGPDAEPHSLDAMAREISEARSTGGARSFDPDAYVAMGVVRC